MKQAAIALAAAGRDNIRIIGARSHNLKGVSCEIPRHSLTAITGVSGSGKSTLAFDTLYAEGQRRYLESLSAYARQFLQKMARPDVEQIENIPPAIAIEQRNKVRNARSTVGTVTEIYDYLRLLYAKVGRCFCPDCNLPLIKDSPARVQAQLFAEHLGKTGVIFYVGANEKGGLQQEALAREGFRRLLVRQKDIYQLRTIDEENLSWEEVVGVVVDRVTIAQGKTGRLLESLEIAFSKGQKGCGIFFLEEAKPLHFYQNLQCRNCQRAFPPLRPAQFSFNSPLGACPTCEGFGRVIDVDLSRVIPNEGKSLKEGAIDPFTKPAYRSCQDDLIKACRRLKIPLQIPWRDLLPEHRQLVIEGGKALKRKDAWYGIHGFFKWLDSKRYKTHVRIFMARYRGFTQCADCHGERLRRDSLAVLVGDKNINQLVALTVLELIDWLMRLELNAEEQRIAQLVFREIVGRLGFLKDVGLGYLSLSRSARTLSGGESQRIALASALGTALTDTLYVLDEPSIGLHPRDHQRLLKVMLSLRNLGNTVVLVEHDPTLIASADYVIDLGPQAGHQGGEIVFAGSYPELLKSKVSLTGRMLGQGEDFFNRKPSRRRPKEWIQVRQANIHNLKDLDLDIPLGVLCAVTGVSGAGKSSLFYNILFAGFQKMQGETLQYELGHFEALTGLEKFSQMILMDQSGLGKSLRSNTATYMDIYTSIRKLFAATQAARREGLTPGSFSFNVSGGRCEVCEGAGFIILDMQFLEEVQVPCEACGGKRFGPKVLGIPYRQKNIVEVLNLTVDEAAVFFAAQKDICLSLGILQKVGLGYLTLGQATSNLSGGEAQRLKLALHMSEGSTEKNLFLFDEPTTGLHPYDIARLLQCYEEMLEQGHSILVIEHNLELIDQADYLLDLGPEGGDGGGRLIAQGTPEEVMEQTHSYTGRYLREYRQRFYNKATVNQ